MVIPKDNLSYGVILGQETMRSLDIDTSVRDNMISLGERELAMVQINNWNNNGVALQLQRKKQKTMRAYLSTCSGIPSLLSHASSYSSKSSATSTKRSDSTVTFAEKDEIFGEDAARIESNVQLSDDESILGANLSFHSKAMGESNATEALNAPKYKIADLEKIAQLSKNLSPVQRAMLLKVLQKHQECFQGRRGNWKGNPVSLEVKPNAIPYWA